MTLKRKLLFGAAGLGTLGVLGATKVQPINRYGKPVTPWTPQQKAMFDRRYMAGRRLEDSMNTWKPPKRLVAAAEQGSWDEMEPLMQWEDKKAERIMRRYPAPRLSPSQKQVRTRYIPIWSRDYWRKG